MCHLSSVIIWILHPGVIIAALKLHSKHMGPHLFGFFYTWSHSFLNQLEPFHFITRKTKGFIDKNCGCTDKKNQEKPDISDANDKSKQSYLPICVSDYCVSCWSHMMEQLISGQASPIRPLTSWEVSICYTHLLLTTTDSLLPSSSN